MLRIKLNFDLDTQVGGAESRFSSLFATEKI